MTNGLVLSAQPAGEVSDPVLDELTAAAEADAELFRSMGDAPEATEQDPDGPVDLRVDWTAVSLRPPRRRGSAAGRAQLIPVLIASTVTPFAQPGRRPPPVWRLDYEAQLAEAGPAHTVAIFPDSETVTKASMSKLTFGVEASGKISFPCATLAAAAPLLALLPGLTIGASASADAGFQVAGLTFTAVKVIAGQIPGAGAKWQLYRVGEELAQAQHLFHVIMAPAADDELRIRATAAVTCRTWYRKKSRPMTWRAEPTVHTISREDLDWS